MGVLPRGEYSLGQDVTDLLGVRKWEIEEREDRFGYDSVDALLARARGTYESGVAKEGIVVRPTTPVYSKVLQVPLSMKVINNDYLLKKRKRR